MFFVATAPLNAEGHVNCSPKGGASSSVILDESRFVYQDYTGSGIETIAHLRENGRIVVMFCAFDGSPRIVRLHGRGEVVAESHPRYQELLDHFPPHAGTGTRAFIDVSVKRMSTSRGYAVPRYAFQDPRDILDKWTETKGEKGVRAYLQEHGRQGIDGLPALDP